VISQFCDWLAGTWLSQRFASLDWFVPAVQTIHILAIAALVTMLMILNLRLLRTVGSGPSLFALARGYSLWIWRCLIVLLVTGTLLTITEPARELLNNVFRLKMLLVVVLVVLTAMLRSTLLQDPDYWTRSRGRRLLGRAFALLSLLFCVSIVVCGRFIAYA
jgi:hypothetical protein